MEGFGAVNGAGWIVRTAGGIMKYIQTGKMQFYGFFIVTFIIIFGFAIIQSLTLSLEMR